MTLMAIQEWSMPDPPAPDVDMCECGHARALHKPVVEALSNGNSRWMYGACDICPPKSLRRRCIRYRTALTPKEMSEWSSANTTLVGDLKALADLIKAGD